MSIHDFGTFYPVFAALITRTTGPILELGAGDHSTTMLHLISRATGRKVVTAETDPAWLKKYENYQSPNHSFHLITPDRTKKGEFYQWQAGWQEWDQIEKENWSVALVDQAPGECRASTILRLKGRCTFIVAHDSEEDYGAGGNYGYAEMRKLFKYCWEWRRFRPYTMVLSDDSMPFGDFEDLQWKS